ncbi:hypothetical protein CEXT_791481 [Caerostris extrusa]|uniref:Uncharacterized protein n=1 Tax=Caerostris extrusa TaxID=172846 RepID=A0AAV4X7L0_CAEEX|nr:hypothetical protein CEXT_791481 [Caerostris extrusa]
MASIGKKKRRKKNLPGLAEGYIKCSGTRMERNSARNARKNSLRNNDDGFCNGQLRDWRQENSFTLKKGWFVFYVVRLIGSRDVSSLLLALVGFCFMVCH